MPRLSRNARRRRLALEGLESRRVMAAYISEVMLSPLFGTPDTDQYVELRGAPLSTMKDTYLAVVDGFTRPGEVINVFDLRDLSFGDNGYFVILAAGNQYTVDLASAKLESPASGFRGLGARFQSAYASINTIDNIPTATSFFLIETTTPPVVGDDIDTNNDGQIEKGSTGVYSNWNVLDSLSMIRLAVNHRAYGDIVFHNGGNLTMVPGATSVQTGNFGYVARVGESTGYDAKEWVAATVWDMNGNGLNRGYRMNYGIFGQTVPRALGGRPIDNIGSVNYTGAIRGMTFVDANNDGQYDPATEGPLAGATIFADVNGNGVQDAFTTVVDPERYAVGLEMANEVPGVALTTGSDEPIFNVQIASSFFTQGVGQRVFSHAGVGFFNTGRKLRMDFERPVRSVAVDFVSGGSDTYGTIEAFDVQGNSLGLIRSQALTGSQRERVIFSVPNDLIAYALAYPDETFNNSSPFGKIDRLEFVQGEATAVSDDKGRYLLNFMQPGAYQLRSSATDMFQTAPKEYPVPAPIIDKENYTIDFGFNVNTPPTLSLVPLEFNEEPRVGKPIGRIVANDINVNQPLQYTLVSVTGSGTSPANLALQIDPATGILSAKIPQDIDFERGAQLIVKVAVTDNASPPIEGEVTINLSDINEAPVFSGVDCVTPAPVSSSNALVCQLKELAAAGTEIGTVLASDEDAGAAGVIRFDILDGDPQGIFKIDPVTGKLTLEKPELLDFEDTSSITLTISATDGSPMYGQFTAPALSVQPALANVPAGTGTTAAVALSGGLPPVNQVIAGETVAFIPGLNGTSVGDPVAIQSVIQQNGVPTGLTVTFPDQTFAALNNVPIVLANPTGTSLIGDLTASVVPVSAAVMDISTSTGPAPKVGQLVSGTGLAGKVTIAQILSPTTVLLQFTSQMVPTVTDASVAFYEAIPSVTAELTVSGLTGSPVVGQYIFGTGYQGTVRIVSINTPTSITVSLLPQGAAPVATPRDISFHEVLNPQRAITPLVIDLSNTNEPPRFVLRDGVIPPISSVPEDAGAGTALGVIRAFDPDGDPIRYDLVGGTAAGLVTVDPETGRVTLNNGAALDFETNPQLTLNIQVADNAEPPLIVTGLVTMTISDVNEAPTITLSRANAVLPEVAFSAGDRVIATATVTDPEDPTASHIDLRIIGGSGMDLVELTPTGEIKLKPGVDLDFETFPNWTVELEAIENNQIVPLSDRVELKVRVSGENEPPELLEPRIFRISDKAIPGSSVAQLNFRDPEGRSVQLTVVGGDTDLLMVEQNGLVRVKDGVDLRAAKTDLRLQVQAKELTSAGLTETAEFQFFVVKLDPFIHPSVGTFRDTLPADLFGGGFTLKRLEAGADPLPTWLSFNATTRELVGSPSPQDVGEYQFTLVAEDSSTPPQQRTTPIFLTLTPVIVPWYNPDLPVDVDQSGSLQPNDALLIINLLNASGGSSVPVPTDGQGVTFKPDVDHDNLVTSLDALIVINALNQQSGSGEPTRGTPAPAMVDAVFQNGDDDDEGVADYAGGSLF